MAGSFFVCVPLALAVAVGGEGEAAKGIPWDDEPASASVGDAREARAEDGGEPVAGTEGGESPDSQPEAEATSNTISVDLPDTEIEEVVSMVADLYNLNIVIPDSLDGSVSVMLNHLTWQEVFDIVLREATPAHTYTIEGNVVRVEKAPRNVIGGDPEIAFLIAAAMVVFLLVANVFLCLELRKRPRAVPAGSRDG